MKTLGFLALCGLTALAAPAIAAETGENRLTIIVGMSPPDQHDNDARLLAKYIGKYLPGNPTVIVQNMPGAGSLKAARYLQNVAPRTGEAIGIVQRGVMMMPLLGFPAANFDPTEFTFVGSRAPETSIVVLWHTAPIKSIQEVTQQEAVVAATGGGADSNTMPFIYNETLGTRFKVIKGYKGGGDMNIAMERGEVQGRVGWSMGAMLGTKSDWYAGKKVRILMQHAMKKHPDLAGIPLAQDLAKTEADRQLLELFAARQGIGFPVFGPPGIPADRAAALKKAYLDATREAGYIADAAKMKLPVEPLSGDDMAALIRKIYATPKPIVDRAKAILIAQGAKLE